MANKIDSNVTGLRFAEEDSPKALPVTPVWYPLEPNSYNGFGGKLTSITRRPISSGRQNQKGTITDLEASGGFQQDLTTNNSLRLLQGFMFANPYEKPTTMPLNAVAVDLGAVVGSAHTIAATAGLDIFAAGNLVVTDGFGTPANNGLFVVASGAAALLTLTAGLADEANAPATASVQFCGHQFAADDISIVMVGGLPRLTSAALNFTTAFPNLTPGEWIYVGGDAAGTKLDSGAGFARIRAITAGYLELDKTDWTATADAGTGKTVQVFMGTTFKNVNTGDSKFKARTYQLERTLGADTNGTMSEYITGASANELTINVKTADKVTIEFGFVGLDNEQRDGTTGVKAGDRPSLVTKDAFNTSSDFSRIRLATVSTTDPKPTALFAFASDLTLKLNNNVTGVKAIGTLGSFDTTLGNFTVDGNLTVYFADVAAVAAVRNNSDVTLDFCIAKKNSGFAFDVPLLTLGNGQVTVEQDKPVTIPLDMSAVEHSLFGHTLLITNFPYLPTAAE